MCQFISQLEHKNMHNDYMLADRFVLLYARIAHIVIWFMLWREPLAIGNIVKECTYGQGIPCINYVSQ